MKLEEAIRKYELLRKQREKELEELKDHYLKRVTEIIREILEALDELERKEPPKDVDPHLLSIALRERNAYVSALRRILGGINSLEELERRLGEISKLHVGHGRYLIALFKKDVYRVNRLLKELSEVYTEYTLKLREISLPDLKIVGIKREMDELRGRISQTERELKALVEYSKGLGSEKTSEKGELEPLEEKENELQVRIRTLQTEIRSKASKLQKPLKRMRIPEASPFLEDTSYSLRYPEEFLELLKMVYPSLDGKSKKSADWLIKNLPSKIEEINTLKEQLETVRREIESAKSASRRSEELALEVRRKISELEEELKKLRSHYRSIEGELAGEIKVLERILGERVERG
ncbi:DNA repair protein Rad50 [Thermococcus profundus]|uniref:DNA repair protein Rad50 n=1 Tax=Thermococcus profundus TaxID=49899 RepID=A0A2Z2MFU2_THEPR|nr:DNA repair protein Rad50 [Thermococcus profundus]